MFNDKVLMITGGTGSFGNAVLKRFLATNVREIRIFSRDEKKQEEMRIALNNDKLKFYIGDVRNYDSLYQAMKGVDYVFHAAALKQVPSCEFYPMEAVRTNVIGTEHVMDAATANGVKRVVLLSTDKAVYPINAMGISKAMAEKLLVLCNALRQCDGFARFGYSVVCLATERRQAAYGNRSQYDAFSDVAGGFGGFSAVCLRAWPAGRYFCAEGARIDCCRFGASAHGDLRRQRRTPDHRYPARREAV